MLSLVPLSPNPDICLLTFFHNLGLEGTPTEKGIKLVNFLFCQSIDYLNKFCAFSTLYVVKFHLNDLLRSPPCNPHASILPACPLAALVLSVPSLRELTLNHPYNLDRLLCLKYCGMFIHLVVLEVLSLTFFFSHLPFHSPESLGDSCPVVLITESLRPALMGFLSRGS